MRILVVEDEPRMGDLLVRGLRGEGHVVDLAKDGDEGLDYASVGDFDIIILDVMLPGLDGISVARKLRKSGVRTPILMLTALDAKKSVVTGLDAGADDYLTKPFAFEELLARIRALARRGPDRRSPVLEIADLTLDPATRSVRRRDTAIKLTPREFQILELLMRHAETVVSRETIIQDIWGHEADIEPNTLDVFMSSLRSKLGAHEPPFIVTARSVGFCVSAKRS